jgi:thioredoxin-related protein
MMSAGWRTDFDKALTDAKRDHKLVLLKFSGSDWCLPCIRMEKEVFGSDSFSHFASDNLVMVNADFPRLSKNKPDKSVLKQNEVLAERYDKAGHFPLTLLIDENGKVLKSWVGYTGTRPADFIREIKSIEDAI